MNGVFGMRTLVISKSTKKELMEKANGTTENFGKFGNSKRLIALLEKEGYLSSINQMNNRSYNRRMGDVECYYHHSSDKSIVQIVLISLEAGTLKVLDFEIMN